MQMKALDLTFRVVYCIVYGHQDGIGSFCCQVPCESIRVTPTQTLWCEYLVGALVISGLSVCVR